MTDNTGDTIKQLCQELEPVKPLAHPLVRLLPWMAITIGYTAAVLYFWGVRDDMEDKMQDPGYMFELTVAFVASITAAISAIYASVPDMRGKSWLLIIPAFLSLVLGAWLVYRAHNEGIGEINVHLGHCIAESLLLSFVPTAILVALVRQGTPTRPYMSTTSVMLATSLMSWVALRISCDIDDFGHGCVAHILPFVLLGGIAGIIVPKLLKW